MSRLLLATLLLLHPIALSATARASRIRELTDISGVRSNQLVGYGLVVGLAGTGDSGQARFTLQSTAAMLRRLGATIDPSMIQTRNAAAVMVTATLPASIQPGTRIDVQVSSLGNARSLFGGVLLQTPLYGADRQVYAVAQGSMLLGGVGGQGASGSSTTVNHLTSGRVPGGAIVERAVEGVGLSAQGPLVLALRDPSFVTAQRIAEAIDQSVGAGTARAIDAARVEINVPEQFATDRVRFVASLQALDVDPETQARVVVDERTGTVVLGGAVRLRPVAVAQGGLTVEIGEQTAISQPNAFAEGDTASVQTSQVQITRAPGTLREVAGAASLSDVVSALNALGAKPHDLITILQAMHAAGALDAEVIIQ